MWKKKQTLKSMRKVIALYEKKIINQQNSLDIEAYQYQKQEWNKYCRIFE